MAIHQRRKSDDYRHFECVGFGGAFGAEAPGELTPTQSDQL